jgi:hypothetical protein
MENNSVITAAGCFTEVKYLKYLNLRRIALRELTSDLERLHSLTFLDLSLNLSGFLESLHELKLERNSLVSILQN